MGYYIYQRHSDFYIPASKVADAKVMLLANHNNDSCYSPNIPKDDLSFEYLMELWRWEIDLDDNGNVVSILFIGEAAWNEEECLKAIAPFVKSGSYIEMQAEEGEQWRWIFDDGELREVHPEVIWPE